MSDAAVLIFVIVVAVVLMHVFLSYIYWAWYVKLYCAWSLFLQNWDMRIINKIYYYYNVDILIVKELATQWGHYYWLRSWLPS